MQRMLVLLSCLAASTSAQDPTTSSPSTTPEPQTTAACTFGGKTWTNGFTYITGNADVYPSIYAECNNGVPTCYRQTPDRDVKRKPIPCDEQEIHALRRRLGIYVPSQQRRWPHGVICYKYGSNFSPEQQDVFTKAMDEFHQKTAVRFVTLDECREKYTSQSEVCDGCEHAFSIVNEDEGCFATLGYQPWYQSRLNFENRCFTNEGRRYAIHELGHVAGLIHEHKHPKREVVILRDDLRVSPDNYQKESDAIMTSYSRNSIMHYRSSMCVPRDKIKRFCDVMEEEDHEDCVIPTANDCDPSQDETFGQVSELSPSDLETLARMYGDDQGTRSPAPSAPADTPRPPAQSSSTHGNHKGIGGHVRNFFHDLKEKGKNIINRAFPEREKHDQQRVRNGYDDNLV